MSEAIVVALITAGASVVVQLIISNSSRQQMDAKLDKALAVQETRLDELTREVRKHNEFASRMPVVEEQIKVINHRIADLEEVAKDV